MKAFSRNKGQDNYNKVLLSIVDGVKKGLTFHLPIKIKHSNEGEIIFEPGMVQVTDREYYYVACTCAEEIVKFSGESSVVITIEKLIRKVSSD